MKYSYRYARLLAAGVDLQRHSAEDGTVYWSMILGTEAIHIITHESGFVAMNMHGHRIGTASTLEEAAVCAAASLLQAA